MSLSDRLVFYGGGRFPFKDCKFDFLFHTEVLEHVFEKEEFLEECYRVLKRDGEMLFTVPFQARYHYIPFDYWRFTPSALERMLITAGFGHIKITPRGNDITVAVYKTLCVIYRMILTGNFAEKVLGVSFSPLIFVLIIVGQFSLRYNIGSIDDSLGYVVTARK